MRRQLAGPRCPAPGLAALEPPARHVHQGGPPAPGSARGGAMDLRGLAIQEHRPFGAWRAAEAHAHEARRPRRHGAPSLLAADSLTWRCTPPHHAGDRARHQALAERQHLSAAPRGARARLHAQEHSVPSVAVLRASPAPHPPRRPVPLLSRRA